jgi:DNA-binding NtrC family response regulator
MWTKTQSVLVVISETLARDALVARLVGSGYEVTSAAHGSVAIELAQTEQFDAVVLSLTIPDMDGLDVIERLLDADPALPVVAIAPQGQTRAAVRALDRGAVEALNRPVGFHDVRIALERAVDQGRDRRRHRRQARAAEARVVAEPQPAERDSRPALSQRCWGWLQDVLPATPALRALGA